MAYNKKQARQIMLACELSHRILWISLEWCNSHKSMRHSSKQTFINQNVNCTCHSAIFHNEIIKYDQKESFWDIAGHSFLFLMVYITWVAHSNDSNATHVTSSCHSDKPYHKVFAHKLCDKLNFTTVKRQSVGRLSHDKHYGMILSQPL